MNDSTKDRPDPRHQPAGKDTKTPRPRSLDPDPDEPPDTKADRGV